jgi:hypothetical protein
LLSCGTAATAENEQEAKIERIMWMARNFIVGCECDFEEVGVVEVWVC